MHDFIYWWCGKKTYLVGLIIALVGILDTSGHPMPKVVWSLLAAVALVTLRNGISKGETPEAQEKSPKT